MGDVTVVISTFGSDEWAALAQERAIPSAESQAPCIHVHGETLAESRNRGLAKVDTELVVFLDADDQLGPLYIEQLLAGRADIRVPAVSYVKAGRQRTPYVPKVPGHKHDCGAGCMEHGNYAVIGSMLRTEKLRAVGGFGDEPVYEDWAAFLRMVRAGATMETIPGAVYIAEWRADSRNRVHPMSFKNDWHHRIAEAA